MIAMDPAVSRFVLLGLSFPTAYSPPQPTKLLTSANVTRGKKKKKKKKKEEKPRVYSPHPLSVHLLIVTVYARSQYFFFFATCNAPAGNCLQLFLRQLEISCEHQKTGSDCLIFTKLRRRLRWTCHTQ